MSMFSTTDFQDYYQKRVTLLVDGRGESYSSQERSATLEFRGRLVKESVQFLTLDDVTATNHPPVTEEDEGLTIETRGTINKSYIIGIFEDRTE